LRKVEPRRVPCARQRIGPRHMPDPGRAAENTFASLLKQARSRSGLTQAELAERAGLSLRTVQHLEGGHGAPYAETARRLADALELGNGERTVFELSVRRIHRASTAMVGRLASREPQGTPSPPQVGSDGEHKQVTVLCCQLAHHVDLSEKLGADQLLDFTHDVIHQAAEEAEQHDGTVGTILGNGLVALFGVPLAHEDHARRAVIAALAIQRRLRGPVTLGGVAHKVHTLRPAEHMRITLHTGSVVVTRVGTPPNQRTSAVGQASAVAAAMQAFAEPGSTIVSDVTARLVAGFARLEPLEQYAPAGGGDPIRVHRLLGIGPRRSPIEGQSQSSMSPFVGREREMALLTDVVDQVVQMGQRPATRSYGQFVGRSGDLANLRTCGRRAKVDGATS